jgi:uncharacterized protein (TIGR03382 family)
MIAENPQNPRNLVAGGLYQQPSAVNDTTTYYDDGVSGVSTSWDGGRTWTTQNLPPNPTWFNTSSPDCDHFHLADTNIVFGPANTVYYVDLSYPGSDVQNCPSSLSGTGLYVTNSTDGGATWHTPVGVAGTNAGGSIDKPWAAVDPATGTIYVAYTDDGNGSGIYLQRSNDSGATWSPPLEISTGTDSLRGVELAVDPWHGVDATWIDQGTAGIWFTRSTDFGRAFSTPKRIATAATEFPSNSPDGFRAYTLPGMTVDAYAGSPHAGRIFAVWQNGTGGAAGTPKVSLSYSDTNGSTWSAPARVDSNHSLEDFQPDVAVGPDGTVYVEWYGEDSNNGHYRLYGSWSRDGGASFDPQLPISNVDSYPYNNASGYEWWIGDYTHILADALGARPLWTDARSPLGWYCTGTSACLWGYVYNISFYTALLVNASLSATVPINATVAGSVPGTGTISLGPSRSNKDWLGGENFTLTAPAQVLSNGTEQYFAEWYGSQNSTNATLEGIVQGADHLRACYVPRAGELCRDPGAPGVLEVQVRPTGAAVTLNGAALATSGGAASLLVAPGVYNLTARAVGYRPLALSVAVAGPGTVAYANLSLVPYPGTLVGSVFPVDAHVLANGSRLAVDANGDFAAALAPGNYSVVAARYGYLTDRQTALVAYNRSTQLQIVLTAQPGVLRGTVTPSDARVTVNGQGVAVDSSGTFAVSAIAGDYWVNASHAGFYPATSGELNVTPLGTTETALALAPMPGTLEVDVTPVEATVLVNGTAIPTSSGVVRTLLLPGTYPVTAAAAGYEPQTQNAVVSFGVVNVVRFALAVAPGWIVGHVGPTPVTLTVDGNAVVVSAAGSFNVTVAAGAHAVNVSATGYLGVERSVVVTPGHASAVSITLAPVTVAGGAIGATAGYGVAIALAIVGAAVVLLVRRRRRRSGPLPPREGPAEPYEAPDATEFGPDDSG